MPPATEKCELPSARSAPLRPFIRAPHFYIFEPRWRCAVSGAHHLLWLSFPAVRGTPQRPLLARANRIHCSPKISRDPAVRRIFQHARAFPVLDLPSNLAAELEVVALVIDRPGTICLHIDSVICIRDQLLPRQWLLTRQNADIRHANNRQPVPTFSPQSSS